MTRCGYVAVLGAPNAGKSTLINALVGTKVSIVSPKVQTTRFRILGIAMQDDAQIILVDTPGIFTPKKRLEKSMVAAAWGGAHDADFICLVIDAHSTWKEDSDAIIEKLKATERKAILILNKVDLVPREELLAKIKLYDETGIFTEIFLISALKGDGVIAVLDYLASLMPESPYFFPEDQISDLPQRMLAAEITREKAFIQLRQELPYALTVETETWEEREDGSVKIEQVIYIERDSQKAMVVGKGGQRVRAIGQSARLELETLLERTVHLFIHVKVKEDWAEKRGFYSSVGLEFDAE
jgi:GTP-binding protein Era